MLSQVRREIFNSFTKLSSWMNWTKAFQGCKRIKSNCELDSLNFQAYTSAIFPRLQCGTNHESKKRSKVAPFMRTACLFPHFISPHYRTKALLYHSLNRGLVNFLDDEQKTYKLLDFKRGIRGLVRDPYRSWRQIKRTGKKIPFIETVGWIKYEWLMATSEWTKTKTLWVSLKLRSLPECIS